MVRGRAARLRIVGVRLGQDRGLQRLLHRAVGGEEGDLLARELFHLQRHILEDELLRAGDAGVAGRVRSGGFHILDAQRLAVGLEEGLAGSDGLHRQVAREGVVHEHLDAPVGAGLDDGVALARLVRVEHDVRGGGDDVRILLRHAGDQQDVVAHLADLVKAGLRARNGLAHHDGLDVRIRGERNKLRDRSLSLGSKVVRVSCLNNVLLTIDRLSTFSSAEFFLALGGGAGQDRDLPVLLGDGAAGESQAEHEGQRQTKQLFHGIPSKYIIPIAAFRGTWNVKRRIRFASAVLGEYEYICNYSIYRFSVQEENCSSQDFAVHFLSDQ